MKIHFQCEEIWPRISPETEKRGWEKICCNCYFIKAALLQTDYGQAGSRSCEISHISSAIRDSIHVPWAVTTTRSSPIQRLFLLNLGPWKQSLLLILILDYCRTFLYQIFTSSSLYVASLIATARHMIRAVIMCRVEPR